MLLNKKIFISGTSSGIGKQIAIDCLTNNSEIFTLSRKKTSLNDVEVYSKYIHRHIDFQGDLTIEEDIDLVVSNLPILDGIVLNAGKVAYRPIALIKQNNIRDIFMLNFDSNVLLIQKLLKSKKINNNASIVFIGSISSHFGIKGTALYAASKAALSSFSKVLASELSINGIRSNTISPGLVQTEEINNNFHKISDNKSYPLDLGSVKDISNQVIFLLSNKSRWVTGTDIVIDGGYSLSNKI